MKKNIFIGIATSLFAIVMFLNTNATDVSSNVFLSDIETMAQASREGGSFSCPNGCLDKKGMCYCNGFHAYKENV